MGRFKRWWSSQNSHVADLLRGASIAGALKAVSALLSFGLSVVLGRTLGADAAGIYFLAFSIAVIAATVGRAGLDSVVVRFVAARASAANWSGVDAVWRPAVTMTLALTCVVAATILSFADILAETAFSDPTLARPIRLMAIAIIPLSLGVLFSRLLLGLSRIRDSILVFSILPHGIALAGTWSLAPAWGVEGAIVAYVTAVSMALAYGWSAWRRVLRQHPLSSGQADSPAGALLRSGIPLLVGALLQLVMQMSGTLMLGAWATTTDVSQFNVAWRTAMLITFVLLAVNTSAQPKFAELYAQRDMASLSNIARKATLMMIAFAAPVSLFFIALPEFVMGLFGEDFVSGALILQILSIGQFVNVAAGSVGVLLVMSGHEREYRNVQIATACVVIALSVLLIPTRGAVGAAIAVASAQVLQNILFGYFVWSKLGLVILSRNQPDVDRAPPK